MRSTIVIFALLCVHVAADPKDAFFQGPDVSAMAFAFGFSISCKLTTEFLSRGMKMQGYSYDFVYARNGYIVESGNLDPLNITDGSTYIAAPGRVAKVDVVLTPAASNLQGSILNCSRSCAANPECTVFIYCEAGLGACDVNTAGIATVPEYGCELVVQVESSANRSTPFLVFPNATVDSLVSGAPILAPHLMLAPSLVGYLMLIAQSFQQYTLNDTDMAADCHDTVIPNTCALSGTPWDLMDRCNNDADCLAMTWYPDGRAPDLLTNVTVFKGGLNTALDPTASSLNQHAVTYVKLAYDSSIAGGSTPTTGSSSGVSTGAAIGIGIGCAIAGGALVAGIGLITMKKKRNNGQNRGWGAAPPILPITASDAASKDEHMCIVDAFSPGNNASSGGDGSSGDQAMVIGTGVGRPSMSASERTNVSRESAGAQSGRAPSTTNSRGRRSFSSAAGGGATTTSATINNDDMNASSAIAIAHRLANARSPFDVGPFTGSNNSDQRRQQSNNNTMASPFQFLAESDPFPSSSYQGVDEVTVMDESDGSGGKVTRLDTGANREPSDALPDTTRVLDAIKAADYSAYSLKYQDIQWLKNPDGSLMEIGHGAFSKVYKVTRDGTLVFAAKVIPLEDRKAEKVFLREAITLFHLRHPNITQFSAVCIHDKRGILVMELMEGGSLFGCMGLRGNDSRRVVGWYQQGRRIALGVAQALHYLHSLKMAHLDLKSANVLLTRDFTPKLADVGFTRLWATMQLSAQDSRIGTFAYMAPEILLGTGQITAAADIFSFGVLLRELCTGEYPSRGRNRMPLAPEEAPEAVNEVILACLSNEPEERPTAQEIFQLLTRCPSARSM